MSGRVEWHQRLHFDGRSTAASDCTWDTAARSIRDLNGLGRTDVFLGYLGDEGVERQLSVSGGNSSGYLVVVQELECHFFLARRPASTEPEGLVEVAVGGLPAYFPPTLVHPLKAALSAAEHYFRTGRRSRQLSWMRGDVAERLRRQAEPSAKPDPAA